MGDKHIIKSKTIENSGTMMLNCEVTQNTYNYTTNEKNYSEEYKRNKEYLLKHRERFYETIHYNKGIEKLKSEKYILLNGFSGSGKTETSIAIATYFADEEQYECYNFSKISYEELKIARKLINEDGKNVIIFDDFLGSIEVIENKKYLSYVEDILKELDYLTCTKVILNSRKSILNNKQVKNINDVLNTNSNAIIDMNKWDELENKEKLFELFCDRYELLDDFREIKVSKSAELELLDVIRHKNFCPLIIDRALKECKTEKEKGVEKLRYSNMIMKNLDKTTQIWDKEVQDLDSYSKDYLLILYSLSRKNVQMDSVKKCYDEYYEVINKKMKINMESMYKNLDSLIQKEGKYIELIHPSLIEYLTSIITEEDRRNIIKGAVFIEQIEMLDDDENTNMRDLMEFDINKLSIKFFNYELIQSKNILENLENLENKQSVFLKYINKFKIEKEELKEIVLKCMEQVLELPNFFTFNNNDDIVEILQLNYDFSSILENEEFKRQLLSRSNYDNISHLLNIYAKKDDIGYNYEKMDEVLKNEIDAIINCFFNDYLIEDDELISEIYSEIEEEIGEGEDVCVDEIVDNLLQSLSEEEILESIKEKLDKIDVYNCNLDISNIDLQNTYDYIQDVLAI